jgi:hypothetical protein
MQASGTTGRKEWLANFFDFYRSLGFLQAYADTPFADLVTAVENLDPELFPGLADIVDDIDDPGDLFQPYDVPTFHMSPGDNLVIDLRLLALFDSKRVWWRWRDLESAPESSPDYLFTFSRWLSTSGGSALAENLQWHPGKPDTLSFALAGVEHKIEATYTTVDYGDGEGPCSFLILSACVLSAASYSQVVHGSRATSD